jgi:polyhydroxyalkanoate synthesis regulator phasin
MRYKSDLAVCLLWAILPALLLIRWQGKFVRDSVQLARYTPPPEVAALARQANMSEDGRRAFYLTTPTIEAKKVGLKLCDSHSTEKTVILGCYVSSKGIFIQKVTDKRLAGTMQVTAAHEMLHAVYHNHLSEGERREIGAELINVFDGLNNPRLKKLIQIYRDRNPDQVSSELHSFLGTEVSKLSPKLEQHYAKYFVDRATVVAMAQKNEQTFAQIVSKAEAIDRQLKSMKSDLDRRQQNVKEQGSSIEQQRRQLERIGNPDDYIGRLTSFNQRVSAYNGQIQVLKQQIINYNRLVNSYNALSSEEKSLNESLRTGGSPQVLPSAPQEVAPGAPQENG